MFESKQITLSCPKCGHKSQETLGRLQDNPRLVCRKCGVTIAVDADDFRRIVSGAEREIDNIIDSIKKSLR